MFLSFTPFHALKAASVPAAESCFIYSAVPYIISWKAEEWHP